MSFATIPANTVALSAIAASSVNVAIPRQSTHAYISNPSANPVAFKFGSANTVAAVFPVVGTPNDIVVPQGRELVVALPLGITYVAAIALVAGPSLVYVSCGSYSDT